MLSWLNRANCASAVHPSNFETEPRLDGPILTTPTRAPWRDQASTRTTGREGYFTESPSDYVLQLNNDLDCLRGVRHELVRKIDGSPTMRLHCAVGGVFLVVRRRLEI